MDTNELLKPRIKMIAPIPLVFSCGIQEGQVWVAEDGFFNLTGAHRIGVNAIEKYPHLFRKIEWWENRLLDDLEKIKFVKVVKYVGYWIVGDIVPITEFIYKKGQPIKYQLQYNHHQTVDTIEPASEEQYLEWQRKERTPNQ